MKAVIALPRLSGTLEPEEFVLGDRRCYGRRMGRAILAVVILCACSGDNTHHTTTPGGSGSTTTTATVTPDAAAKPAPPLTPAPLAESMAVPYFATGDAAEGSKA